MRYNEKELRYVSRKITADREGRLGHKTPKDNGYKERWFKLKNNLLYFYRTEHGVISESEAAGVLVLERCQTQMEVDVNRLFVFSVIFEDEVDKKHLFSGQNETQIRDWMDAINKASYDHLRSKVQGLRAQIAQRKAQISVLSSGSQGSTGHQILRHEKKKHSSLMFPSEVSRKDKGMALLVDL